jgi:hypothetical protein
MSVPFYYYYLQSVLVQDELKLSDLGISLTDSNGKIKNAVDLIEELWNDEKVGEQLNDSNK